MNTEENNQAPATEETQVEEKETTTEDNITLPRAEYDKLQSDLGSLKREKKDWTKSQTKTEVTPEKNQEVISLQERLDKQVLKAANITHEDDVKLAKETAQKWNMSIDELVEDADFKLKLDKLQTDRANAEATTGIKGDKAGGGTAKETAEYWNAKGKPPTPEDIPNRKIRQNIIREMRQSKSGDNKTYYNE